MAARKKTTPTLKITGRVFGGGLYIRKEPSTDAPIEGILKNNARIEIFEVGDTWHKIDRGYIMAKWVKLDAGTN